MCVSWDEGDGKGKDQSVFSVTWEEQKVKSEPGGDESHGGFQTPPYPTLISNDPEVLDKLHAYGRPAEMQLCLGWRPADT